jgi:hypothetical protein
MALPQTIFGLIAAIELSASPAVLINPQLADGILWTSNDLKVLLYANLEQQPLRPRAGALR